MVTPICQSELPLLLNFSGNGDPHFSERASSTPLFLASMYMIVSKADRRGENPPHANDSGGFFYLLTFTNNHSNK